MQCFWIMGAQLVVFLRNNRYFIFTNKYRSLNVSLWRLEDCKMWMVTVRDKTEWTESRGGSDGEGGRADLLEDKKALRMRGMLEREERRMQLVWSVYSCRSCSREQQGGIKSQRCKGEWGFLGATELRHNQSCAIPGLGSASYLWTYFLMVFYHKYSVKGGIYHSRFPVYAFQTMQILG